VSEETSAGRVLFPDRTVRLSDGRTAVIRPWGLRLGRLLVDRVANIADAFVKAAASGRASDLVGVIRDHQDDVIFIVQRTAGFSDEEMDRLAYEDLFVLAQAVIETSIFRVEPDGSFGGLLGKLLALGTRAPTSSAAKTETAPSPTPSSSS